MDQTKFLLQESDIPKQWYNINADIAEHKVYEPAPYLHPGTGQPIGPADLAPLFPMECIKQEVSTERWIDIPEEVREVYSLWRPTPFFRARRLEKMLDTPAHIYYKYEGVSPAGSHKPNTAVAQAFYNKAEGVKRITTETGAGQWGSALSFACQAFDIECKVYMVKISFQQKPYRRVMMETWGANCVASPSSETNYGRKILAEDPECTGSLGIAISEAVEDAATREDTHYSLGSVLNHVLMHQTVVGQEVKKQMEMAGEYPDILIGCMGGGSNFAGFSFPFLYDKLRGDKPNLRVIGVEPASCPSVTKGEYTFDYGDTAGMAPIAKMYTLGHDFVPPSIHAGGLRYHGMAPQISGLYNAGVIEAYAYPQKTCFEAGVMFARAEGIIPAPEPTHAIRQAINEAVTCKQNGEKKVIVFNLCGHGHLDMAAYEQYFSGSLEDYEYPEEKVRESMAKIPKVALATA